jgi:hypothetical protein
MVESNRCSKTYLSRTNSTASFHDEPLACKDIFSQGCIMRIKKWHIEWFERAA